MSFFEDDLTESDMKFLERFNQLGRSDTADAEYNPSQDELPEPQGEGDNPDVQGEVIADEGPQGGQGESDYDFDPDGEGETDSDEGMIDESKMDISDLETGQHEGESKQSSDEADEKDHLESGDSDSEIQDGESDLEYDDDDLYDEHDDDLNHDDEDNYQLDQEAEDNRHEGEDDLDTDNSDTELGGNDAQIEEDDGEGERGNSDEARESDEPIGGGDDPEEEPDDKGMTEDEAQELIDQELNAEGDSDFGGDAQQELEDHLRNEQDEPPKDEQKQSQSFSDLPEPGQGCDDHCEDNESDAEHECPRCAERIMRERKEWGVIATDMHGNDIYVGDKVRVEIPMSFFTHGSMLTANVPNLEMERWAVKTNGADDKEALWLSGKLISQFTGYHLHNAGNPIWTFSKGRKLAFAEKIGEPEREGGGQGDIEDMIEELKQDLDEGKFDENGKFGEQNEDSEPELEENLDEDEPEDDSEEQENKNGKLTTTQLKRYENIFNRLEKKVAQTFGSTVESIEAGPIYQTDEGVARPIKVKSRGVEYHIVLVAKRA